MALPTCECVAGQFMGDQWTSIYAAARQWANQPLLPTAECVSQMTMTEKMTLVFCAVATIAGTTIEV